MRGTSRLQGTSALPWAARLDRELLAPTGTTGSSPIKSARSGTPISIARPSGPLTSGARWTSTSPGLPATAASDPPPPPPSVGGSSRCRRTCGVARPQARAMRSTATRPDRAAPPSPPRPR